MAAAAQGSTRGKAEQRGRLPEPVHEGARRRSRPEARVASRGAAPVSSSLRTSALTSQENNVSPRRDAACAALRSASPPHAGPAAARRAARVAERVPLAECVCNVEADLEAPAAAAQAMQQLSVQSEGRRRAAAQVVAPAARVVAKPATEGAHVKRGRAKKAAKVRAQPEAILTPFISLTCTCP